MQVIEERAIATNQQTLPIWLRYVDDTFATVHQDEINTFHRHLNEQNPDIQFFQRDWKKWKDFFSILPGNSWQSQTTDNSLQKADTWPIILQPYCAKLQPCIKTLTRRAQLVHLTAYRTKLHIWNAFSRKTTITQTLSNSTLTETLLKRTRQPTTGLLVLQQRLYLTSKALLRLYHASSSLTTSV